MFKRVVKLTSLTGASAVAAGNVALYLDAPMGDRGDGTFDPTQRHDRFPEWLHDVGRIPIFALATAASKLYMLQLNSTKVEGLGRLEKHLTERPANTALITVSNHSATVDDPAVFATMLPWKYALPWNGRWSLVSQEYSYTRNQLLSQIFFSSKTLPIKRGGGIDQPMLATIFEKVQQGAWVHIFPEGKIEQNGVIGGRMGPRVDEIGHLKWGTAKLIARADVRPVVLPIYHTNMHQVMPQDENNRLITMVPQTGVNVTVRVGEPINFDDLLEKYAEARVSGSEGPWATEEREKALYSAIMLRIEEALLTLAKDMQEEPKNP